MKKEKLEPLFKPSRKHKKEKIESAINLLNEIVKVRIAPSQVHGVGVFALRDIKRGEKLNLEASFQMFDVPYSQFKKLRPEVRELLLERWPNVVNGSAFIYPDTKMQAYTNHSDFPNYDGKNDVALRKIIAGEEITENYREIAGFEKVYPWLKSKANNKAKKAS